jgi:hypothetical protein
MQARPGWSRAASPRLGSLAALAGYVLLAFIFLGLPLLVGPGDRYVGVGADPQIFIWSFAWWPHATLHGQNPFVTHVVWAPDGVNLAWVTAVPGLALLFAPLTLLAGAIVAYNVAAVLMPAMAAWSAFLLCRYVTDQVWPSLVGGYLFGFSSYVLTHEFGGHLHLTSILLLPLMALVVLRFLDGDLDGRGLVVRLAPMFGLQLLFSTEIAFTLALAFAVALGLCLALVPARRRRTLALLPYLLGAGVVAALLTAPFLYYLLTGFRRAGYHPQGIYVADALNFVTPPDFVAIAGGTNSAISRGLESIHSGQEAYIGLPALLLMALFAWGWARSAVGRFLLAAFAVCVVAALGEQLAVDGHRVVPLPWAWVNSLPSFNNVLAVRIAVYASLVVSVAVALWTAAQRNGVLRWLLPALAALAIAPGPTPGGGTTAYQVPAFFTERAYQGCLDSGENVLPLPIAQEGAMLWQVVGDFRFSMAGGYLAPDIPVSFKTPESRHYITAGNRLGLHQAPALKSLIADKHVTSNVVDQSQAHFFAGALDDLAAPSAHGGVLLYRLGAAPPSCAGA